MTRFAKIGAWAALATVAFLSQTASSQAAESKKSRFAALLNIQQQDNFATLSTTATPPRGVRAMALTARNAIEASALPRNLSRFYLRFFRSEARYYIALERAVTRFRIMELRQELRHGLITTQQFLTQRALDRAHELAYDANIRSELQTVRAQLRMGIIPPATAIRGGSL